MIKLSDNYTTTVVADSISPQKIRFVTLVVQFPHGIVEEVIRPRELCYSTDIEVNVAGWLPSAPRAFVMSSTKWQTVTDQWLASPNAQVRALAYRVTAALAASKSMALDHGEWHLPFVVESDVEVVIDKIVDDAPQMEFDLTRMYELSLTQLQKISAARCMTIGRNTAGDSVKRINQDLERFSQTVEQCGIQLVGFTEHQATADYCTDDGWRNAHLHANTPGWCQFSQIHPWHVWRDRQTT